MKSLWNRVDSCRCFDLMAEGYLVSCYHRALLGIWLDDHKLWFLAVGGGLLAMVTGEGWWIGSGISISCIEECYYSSISDSIWNIGRGPSVGSRNLYISRHTRLEGEDRDEQNLNRVSNKLIQFPCSTWIISVVSNVKATVLGGRGGSFRCCPGQASCTTCWETNRPNPKKPVPSN